QRAEACFEQGTRSIERVDTGQDFGIYGQLVPAKREICGNRERSITVTDGKSLIGAHCEVSTQRHVARMVMKDAPAQGYWGSNIHGSAIGCFDPAAYFEGVTLQLVRAGSEKDGVEETAWGQIVPSNHRGKV